MPEKGHSLPKWVGRDTSDLPSIATEERTSRNVSNVPATDSCTAAKSQLHSITSSARARIFGDSSMPNALAMRRLILRSNLVGRSKGKSPGFAPFRTRSSCEIRGQKGSEKTGQNKKTP